MSYLAQEMMGFGKPSRLVENILNGTDNIVYTKRETPSPRQCSHCGSTAQVKEFDREYEENTYLKEIVVIRWYQCGCGHKFTTYETYTSDNNEQLDDDNVQASQTLA